MPTIENKEARLLSVHGAQLDLVPGLNEVTAEQLAEALKYPTIKARIDAGTLVVVDETAAPAGTKAGTVAEAVKLIEETEDPALLEQWAAQDERKGVQEAITKRLDALKGE